MFRRRTPVTRLSQIRSVLWPERGFRRLFAYLIQRVIRLPGSSSSIAVGLACGVAASFTPFIGLHLLVAALLAILLRGNVLASAIGTFFGNPWTFLFIWVSDYRLGLWLLQRSGYGDKFEALSFQELAAVMSMIMQFLTFSGTVGWQKMLVSLEQVLFPITIGGTVLAVFSWAITFVITYYGLEMWRSHRAKRLAKTSSNHRNIKKFN